MSFLKKRFVRRPVYGPMEQRVEAVCWNGPAAAGHPALMVSAGSLGGTMAQPRRIREALALMEKISPDDYTRFMAEYYRKGLERWGEEWSYADIVTVLLGLADVLKPATYLEIGVRRGRSACAVASKAPQCDFYLFDKWVEGYAGMDNPGPELVAAELRKIGHRGKTLFQNGNSHVTLKMFFAENPGLAFDLVTVDGDHGEEGALEDLCDVLPRLKIGGAVVFDDIRHPRHPYLRGVWRDCVERDARFACWSFEDAGFGVAFALRRA